VSVVTRDVSEVDAFVECQVPTSIPLYRLVHFQVERSGRDCPELPAVLQHGKVLSAVYRVGPYRPSSGTPLGYALRLLIDPARLALSADAHVAYDRATAQERRALADVGAGGGQSQDPLATRDHPQLVWRRTAAD